MNRMMTAAASLTAAALLPTTALAATWTLDVDHSQVGFKVRHMMVSYSKGRFQRFQGTIRFDDAHPENARIDVSIDAASIDTHQEKRDEHLRSADFLDVKNHPTLTFKSTRVKKVAEGRLEVLGDLTLRGVTRPVTLAVSDLDEARKDPWAACAAAPPLPPASAARTSASPGTWRWRRAASSSGTRSTSSSTSS